MDFNQRGFLGASVDEWRGKNIAAHQIAFAFSYDVSTFCERTKFLLKISTGCRCASMVVALFLKMLSDYQAALLLFERGMIPQGEALFRCMLEAFFLISEMVNDVAFVARWVKSDDIDRLRMVQMSIRASEEGVPPNVDADALASTLAEVQRDADNASRVPGPSKMLTDKHFAWMHGLYMNWSFPVHSAPRGVQDILHLDSTSGAIRSAGPTDIGLDETLAWGGAVMMEAWKPLSYLFDLQIRDQLRAYDDRFHGLMSRIKSAAKA